MSKKIQIDDSWYEILHQEFEKQYFTDLKKKLVEEKNTTIIYPKGSEIFNAFNKTPIFKVKVVVLGQDPYHGPGQAHGLSFSVPQGVKPPPSLVNIFKELEQDLQIPRPLHGDLSAWAAQGVFLLNAFLTVRAHEPASHQSIGWHFFTDAVIQAISQAQDHVVFILWGSFAHSKEPLINSEKHLILKSTHPSPFSAHRGFLGSKPFSQANTWLQSHGIDPIDWRVL